MFWGVTLESGKKYSQVVSTSFYCTMAALEPLADVKDDNRTVSLVIEHQKSEYILCTLEHGKLNQQPLQLNFVEGEEVCFYTIGQGTVHMTGYHCEDAEESLLPDEMDSSCEDDDDEEEEDDDDESIDEKIPKLVSISNTLDDSDEEDLEWIPAKSKDAKKIKELRESLAGKKQTSPSKITNGKAKIIELEDDDDDEEEEEEETEDEDESEDEEETDDGSDEEESKALNLEAVKSKKRKMKTSEIGSKTKKVKTDDAKDSKKKKKPSEDLAVKSKKSSNKNNISNGGMEVEEDTDGDSDDDDDDSDDSVVEEVKPAKTPPANKNQPKIIPEKSSPGKKPDESPKSPSKTPQSARTLPGGTVVSDIKTGKGPVAAKGKIVHVYYSGKLSNGKEFDSVSSGKPFRFKLGKKEVIKGWDLGVEGMRVGGKRKLIIPPTQAYGKKKVGDIPGNSTLHFEVELKAVN